MTFKATILVFIVAITLQAQGQQKRTYDKKARQVSTFPFKILTGGIIILKATVDKHQDSLNFILDTGSGGISLDSATVKKLGIQTVKTDRTIRGIGGIRTLDFAYGHTLNLPRLKVENLDFHINDYDLLTSAYGVKIDGIIGYSVLRRYIVSINYDNHFITFYSPGWFRYPWGGFMLKPSFTTLPLQDLQVQDARLIDSKFLFDTGAGLCMLFSEKFVTDSNFLTKNKKLFQSYGEGIGGKKAMQMTVIKRVKVGPYRFRKVPVFVFSDDYNITAYPNTKGLIGNDILRRFNVVINYPDHCIHMRPNSHFADDFDYAYTGLELFLVNDRVTVEDVVPGSPAEKAGFEVGDVVLAVNTRFTNDIQVYKQVLQEVGARHKVIIRRGEELMQLTLSVTDIR